MAKLTDPKSLRKQLNNRLASILAILLLALVASAATRPAHAADECPDARLGAGTDFMRSDPVSAGECAVEKPFRLPKVDHAVIRPTAIQSCKMVQSLDKWMREVVQPAARRLLDAEVTQLRNVSSFVCRTRYSEKKKKKITSEHGFANALDIASFKLDNGDAVVLSQHWRAPENKAAFLKELHEGACKIFGTVLGPDANAAHHDHFHLDMAPRKWGNYCR